jgi:hypothetical protein
MSLLGGDRGDADEKGIMLFIGHANEPSGLTNISIEDDTATETDNMCLQMQGRLGIQ